MSDGLAIRRTCATCVYYLAATMECMYWDCRLDSEDSCSNWLGEDGSGIGHRETSGMILRVRIAEEDDGMANTAEMMEQIARLQEQVESLQVQVQNLIHRLDQQRERADQQDKHLDVLAAEITRLQEQGGGSAERALRLVEQVISLAERRESA